MTKTFGICRILSGEDVVGTGVLLPGGWLATCAHVVAQALLGDKSAYGQTPPEGEITAQALTETGRIDLTVTLEDCVWGPAMDDWAPRHGGDYALLKVTNGEVPGGIGLSPSFDEVGERVPLWSYGFPGGSEEFGRDANLKLTNMTGARADGLVPIYSDDHMDEFVKEGFSGAPVFVLGWPRQPIGLIKSVFRSKKLEVEEAAMVPCTTLLRAWQGVQQRSHKLFLSAMSGSTTDSFTKVANSLVMNSSKVLVHDADNDTPKGASCADDAQTATVSIAAPPLDQAHLAAIAEWVVQERKPTKGLLAAATEFHGQVVRDENRLPEPYNQGYLKKRAAQLQRCADDVSRLHPDRLGEFAYDLLKLEGALNEPAFAEDFEALRVAYADLAASLGAEAGSVASARAMPSDGEWPPGTRGPVRVAAAGVVEALAPLEQTEEVRDTALNIGAEVGYIAAQTYLDRPNWPVMARNALASEGRIKALSHGPWGGLLEDCGDLRALLLKTQQRMIAGLPDGAIFRDLPDAPEMVVVPAGRFWMGSPQDEEDRRESEGPRHEVEIGERFALARFALTFEEYDLFCEETGRNPPNDENWGRGRRPVINVSWDDAKAYLAWLSSRTGRAYRLPAEAEWEYACRAGTQTPFSFGTIISTDIANYRGKTVYEGSQTDEFRAQSVPVDKTGFFSNGFGLWQMHGNVWEWCEDDWDDNYTVPRNQTPFLSDPRSDARVLRGGSWLFNPRYLRSAYRLGNGPGFRSSDVGFRPARTLITP